MKTQPATSFTTLISPHPLRLQVYNRCRTGLFDLIFDLRACHRLDHDYNNKSSKRHTVNFDQLEDLDFADDISLLSHTHQQMQHKIHALAETARRTGLFKNTCKTKAMRFNTAQIAPVILEDQPLEEVDSFVYLGSNVSKTGDAEEDVKDRVGKVQYAFNSLRPILLGTSVWVRNLEIYQGTRPEVTGVHQPLSA